MKLKIIFLITCFSYLQAQTYEKDWALFYSKIESGTPISISEANSFANKYKKELAKYPDNSTQLYSVLANNYYDKEHYDQAKQNYLESYRYAQSANDTSLKHIVELSLAVLSYNTNNLLEAETYYVKCLAGMAALYGQSSREYTQLFYDYTRLLIDLGKYDVANPYVDALLYYYKTLDGENNIRYIGLLNCKAIIYQNTGNYKEAISILERLAEGKSILKLGDSLGYVISLSNLGDVLRETGEYEMAITYSKKAKSLFYQYRIQKSQETIATIDNNLALCYKAMSDYKQAEESYNHAIQIYKTLNQTETEPYCSTLSNKADLLGVLGRYGEASELLLTALQIRRERFGTVTENYANALSNLGNIYFNAEYFEQALEKHLEAKKVYEQTVGVEHQGYGNCLNSLSLCYLYFKDYKKAEEFKLEALAIIEKSVGKSHYRYSAYLISTYGLYLKTNQHDKAERNIKEALVLIEKNFGKHHELYASAQLALAEIYAITSRYEESGNLYLECLAFYASEVNDYFDAMGEENQMDFLGSISSAFKSYNIFIINYKLAHAEKNISPHLKKCMQYQLLLKSLLANRSAQMKREVEASSDNELKSVYRNWVMLKTELINKYKSTAAANEDYSELYKKTIQLETQLKAKLSRFSKTTEISFEELKTNLQPSEAALEIFKVREAVNDSTTAIKYGALIIRKELLAPELIIFKDGDRLENFGFANYTKCIDELIKDSLSYNVFFKPLEHALRDVKRIYVNPDGIFNKVNILSLYNPVTRKYLVDDLDLITTSNLSSLSSSTSQVKQNNRTAAIFGYPDYDYDFKIQKARENLKSDKLVAKRYGLVNLPKLPGTKTEVEYINKTLKENKWQSNVYTEQFASEKNLRSINSPNVLHIATHGFYLKDVESDDKLFLGFENSSLKNNSLLRSGIILAGAGPATQDSTNQDSENDGVLTAYEASFLNLNHTDLVILSACQTGLGDDMGTEGVAGLQRSLSIAGAKNIIMSLWPVDDLATQYLMTEFYTNYALHQNAEAAFKFARQQVKEKYPQPLYWGAFVFLKTFN